jgi:hypothetical protein
MERHRRFTCFRNAASRLSMDQKQLDYFVHVADTSRFSKAAQLSKG